MGGSRPRLLAAGALDVCQSTSCASLPFRGLGGGRILVCRRRGLVGGHVCGVRRGPCATSDSGWERFRCLSFADSVRPPRALHAVTSVSDASLEARRLPWCRAALRATHQTFSASL